MSEHDIFIRLLAENFSLKDQLAASEEARKKADDSYMYWYRKCVAAESKSPVEDIPLTMGRLNAECRIATAGGDADA